MKKAKKVGRKALSVILAAAMMLTTFVFFDIGSVFGLNANKASDDTITVTNNDLENGVYFYVPEEIYLASALNSYTTQDRYSFQWYVDSAVDENTHEATLRTGENSSGNFYFYYQYASQVSVSYKYLNQDMSDMTAYTVSTTTNTTSNYANSNCYLKLASYSTYLRATNTSSTSSYIKYTVANNTISTTITNESLSPYLLASTSGYYIEWTVSFVDSRDGLTKYANAYTYVYKPYVQPVGVGLYTLNNRGDDSYGSDLSWVSGIHGLNSTGSYYPKANTGNNGLVPFSSSNPVGIQLGDVGEKLYAQYATSLYSDGYFQYSSSNTSPESWLSTTASTYFTSPSFNYVSNKTDGSNSGNNAFYTYGVSPVAKIMVDSSRYTNMSGIPNLSIGLMVTDDQGSTSGGAWYVGDYSGKTTNTASNTGYNKNGTSQGETYWNDITGIMYNEGTYSSTVAGMESEGVKYNGRWIKTLTAASTSGYYNIKTMYFNKDGSASSNYGGDTIWDAGVLQVYVTINNKDTLRSSFETATSKMANFSMKADGTSYYYDATSSYWTNFLALYKAAGKLLANLDTLTSITVNGTSYTCETLATALNSAISNIENCRYSSTATARFLALTKTSTGTYILSNIYDETSSSYATDVTAAYKYGNTVTTKSKSFTGYKYVGSTTGITHAAGNTVGASYASLITSTDATAVDSFAKTANISHTFFYVPNEFSTIVDTTGGIFNYLKIKTTGFPSDIGGIGYPTYAASSGVDTDINYSIDGNNVTAWSTASSTNEQYQFLPYYVDLSASTGYVITFDVTGTSPSNVALSAYNSAFTGGNGSTVKSYALTTSGTTFTTAASDSGRAYIKLELLGDARNGKSVMISNICIKKADNNELYLDTTNGYPASFTATSADKTGMSYTATGTSKVIVTSQYNSLTYQQKQLLPYYISIKPGCSYKFTYDVAGVTASQVHFVLYNSTFTGGNDTTNPNFYTFSASGTSITAGASDNGIAQLRIELTGVAANTKATITNLKIVNTDTKTAINGSFNQTTDLGIPVKEGYKFAGWSVASNSGGTANGIIGKAVDNISTSNCIDKTDMMWIENGTESYLSVDLSDKVASGSDFFDVIDFDLWGAKAGFTPGASYTLSAKVRVNSITTTGIAGADSERSIALRDAANANEWYSQTEYKAVTDGWVDFTLTRTFSEGNSPRVELAFYIGGSLYTLGGVDTFSANLDIKDIQVKDSSNNVVYNFADNIGNTSSGQLYRYRFGSNIDVISANWVADTCKVIFRDTDGTVLSEQNVNYGSAATAPTTNPTKFGKTFSGWNTDYSAVTKDLIIEPIYTNIDINVILSSNCIEYVCR
jgi:hypothetical protein